MKENAMTSQLEIPSMANDLDHDGAATSVSSPTPEQNVSDAAETLEAKWRGSDDFRIDACMDVLRCSSDALALKDPARCGFIQSVAAMVARSISERQFYLSMRIAKQQLLFDKECSADSDGRNPSRSLPLSHRAELLSLADDATKVYLAQEIARAKLSVKDVRKIVRQIKEFAKVVNAVKNLGMNLGHEPLEDNPVAQSLSGQCHPLVREIFNTRIQREIRTLTRIAAFFITCPSESGQKADRREST